MSAAFVERFGRPPEGRWSSPGRVNIIGEFTDYNESFVLPTTLPMATHATLARREDDLVRVTTAEAGVGATESIVEAHLADLEPGVVEGWSAYVFGVAWALLESGARIGGADVLIESEVPLGAGLSSSAALECSVALAFRASYAIEGSLEELALICQRAENDFVGVPCGIMDQMASLLCIPGSALLLDTRSLDHRQVPFALKDAGLALMVLDTRVSHELGDSAYAERRAACERAAAKLGLQALRDVDPADLGATLERLDDPVLAKRVRHIVTEQARVLAVADLLEAGRPVEIGPVLTAGHASLRYDYEVSCVELDTAVDAALEGGALGARMIGGGFGGSAIALVHAEKTADVAASVESAFSGHGFGAPRIFVAAPGEGAQG